MSAAYSAFGSSRAARADPSREAADGGERVADLVRDLGAHLAQGGQLLGLHEQGLVLPQALLRLAHLARRDGRLDRDRRLGSQDAEELRILLAEAPLPVARLFTIADPEDTHRAVEGDHRHEQHRTRLTVRARAAACRRRPRRARRGADSARSPRPALERPSSLSAAPSRPQCEATRNVSSAPSVVQVTAQRASITAEETRETRRRRSCRFVAERIRARPPARWPSPPPASRGPGRSAPLEGEPGVVGQDDQRRPAPRREAGARSRRPPPARRRRPRAPFTGQ